MSRFTNQDISVVALVRGEERYVILYTDAQRTEALRLLGRWATRPDLDFSWQDAWTLSQRIGRDAT